MASGADLQEACVTPDLFFCLYFVVEPVYQYKNYYCHNININDDHTRLRPEIQDNCRESQFKIKFDRTGQVQAGSERKAGNILECISPCFNSQYLNSLVDE